MKSDQHNTILIVGASRGLGHAMAATFLQHGWEVIGTVRDLSSHTPLHDLAKTHPLRLRLATLDIRDEAQLAALQATLPPASLDMLFVNAGTTNRDPSQTIGDVSTEEFYQVMLTNALAYGRGGKRVVRLSAWWCKGGSFDFPILKSAFERSSLEGVSMLPWLYWNECCFRSLLTVAGAIGYAPHPRRSVAHNALTDAIYQAEQVCEIWQRLTSPHLESL